jgi:hypothetical protein
MIQDETKRLLGHAKEGVSTHLFLPKESFLENIQ